MRIITDESNEDLAGLLGTIKTMAPDIWTSSERRFILPQKLEDLENPEYLAEIKEKIRKMKHIKDQFDEGSITKAEYQSKKSQIIMRMHE
jgi:hypothetical protein